MIAIKSREELISEISYALRTYFDESCFYLSLTEQIVSLNSPAALVGEDCLWPRKGDEVIRIDPLESWESFRAMEAFADRQPQEIADKLYRALNGSRPFARFRAAVDILDLQKEWHAFQDEWYGEKAEEWLRDNDVDFVDGKVVAKGNTLIWDDEEED